MGDCLRIGGYSYTIFTNKIANYRFVDTANIDGIRLPECIVVRDSIIGQSTGIDQRGHWSFTRKSSIIDIWSLDRKELIFSLIKGEFNRSRHYDDLIPNEKNDDTFGDLNRFDFYEYDIEFNFGEIVITNLRRSETSSFKPKYREGRYQLIDGALERIE